MHFLLTFIMLAGFAYGQEPDIRAAEKTWAKAILTKDTATLNKLLGDQLIYAHSTGIVDSKSTYIAKIASGKQLYSSVDHESLTVKLYGGTAVVHARMHINGVNQDGKFDDKLMMMHVWLKTGADWQLVAHQTTRLP
jgi:ketosteroid isomerase-like protein